MPLGLWPWVGPQREATVSLWCAGMGDGRGWGQGAGNERRVACGQGIEDPCPRYLVHVMRGNGHKENRGTERLRPPLRVKASHQLNPGDPGLKVALEPWSPWIPAAPAASCCSDLGRGWPPTCPGGPPTLYSFYHIIGELWKNFS